MDCYDPKTDTWTFMGNWTDNPTSDAVAMGYKDVFFVAGGYNPDYTRTTKVIAFNVTSRTWDSSPPSMAHARGDTQVAQLGDYYYVAGGYDYFNINTTVYYPNSTVMNTSATVCNFPTHYMERFEPATRTWTSEASMRYGRGDLAMGTIGNYVFSVAGETYTLDGYCNLSLPVNVVERFNQTSQTWYAL